MREIKRNSLLYTTQDNIEEIKINPQVYTIREGMEEIKNNPRYTQPKAT